MGHVKKCTDAEQKTLKLDKLAVFRDYLALGQDFSKAFFNFKRKRTCVIKNAEKMGGVKDQCSLS